jgi:hypothetical protein
VVAVKEAFAGWIDNYRSRDSEGGPNEGSEDEGSQMHIVYLL